MIGESRRAIFYNPFLVINNLRTEQEYSTCMTNFEVPLTLLIATRNSEMYITKQIQHVIASLTEANFRVGEVLIIDDGSNDATIETLKLFSQIEPRLKIVSHTRPRGLQLAVSTGVDLANSEYVLICEDDFEYSPGTFVAIVTPVLDGKFDACVACSDVGAKRVTSKLFWALLKFITSGQVSSRELMLRCIGPDMVRELRLYRDAVRTITGLMLEIGLKVSRVAVSGVSTGFRRSGHQKSARLHLFVDVYLTLSRRPLFSLLYFAIGLIGVAIGVFSWGLSQMVLTQKMSNSFIWVSVGTILSLCSLVIFLFWIMSQMLLLIIREVRRRPLTSYQLVDSHTSRTEDNGAT